VARTGRRKGGAPVLSTPCSKITTTVGALVLHVAVPSEDGDSQQSGLSRRVIFVAFLRNAPASGELRHALQRRRRRRGRLVVAARPVVHFGLPLNPIVVHGVHPQKRWKTEPGMAGNCFVATPSVLAQIDRQHRFCA